MKRKTLHKSAKKRRGKKRFSVINLLLLPLLILLLLVTVFQLQQKQTFQEHAAQTDTCGVPGDKGNEMGVGKYCTQGGGQCLGTGSPICSADIELSGHGICSKACNTDADCGTGATCYQDTLGKGCKPDVCTTTQPTATPKPTATPIPTAVPLPTAIPTLKPTPTTAPTAVPVITAAPTVAPTTSQQATALLFSVYLNGIGSSGDNRNQSSTLSNKTPVHPQRTFTVTVTDNLNNQIISQQNIFTYDPAKGLYSGTAILGNAVATDKYGITISTATFMKKTLQGIQITRGQQIPLPAIALTAGDVNNDGILDMRDYNSIISCFSVLAQPTSCTDAQKQAADLNDDGKVDQIDYNLFLRELNVSIQ